VLDRAGRYGRAAVRWLRLLATRRRAPGLRVFYGHDRLPGPGETVAGGTAKFQRLAVRFPNSPAGFSLLYLGSTWLPRDLRLLLWLARRRGAPIVVNQSGVAYPGWAGAETDEINRHFRRALLAADHVLYQSEFCKRSADEFLGSRRAAGKSSTTPLTSSSSRPVLLRLTSRPCCFSGATRRRPTGSRSRCAPSQSFPKQG